MKKLSTEEVEHIAKLARIKLTDSEKEKYCHDLTSVLEFVDQLNEVDTSDVEPIMNITALENVFDEDVARKDPSAEKIIQNAPESKDGYFKVGKVLE